MDCISPHPTFKKCWFIILDNERAALQEFVLGSNRGVIGYDLMDYLGHIGMAIVIAKPSVDFKILC
jgi:hypothetical protein